MASARVTYFVPYRDKKHDEGPLADRFPAKEEYVEMGEGM